MDVTQDFLPPASFSWQHESFCFFYFLMGRNNSVFVDKTIILRLVYIKSLKLIFKGGMRPTLDFGQHIFLITNLHHKIVRVTVAKIFHLIVLESKGSKKFVILFMKGKKELFVIWMQEEYVEVSKKHNLGAQKYQVKR